MHFVVWVISLRLEDLAIDVNMTLRLQLILDLRAHKMHCNNESVVLWLWLSW